MNLSSLRPLSSAGLLGALLLTTAAPSPAQSRLATRADLEGEARAALWLGDGDLVRLAANERADGSVVGLLDYHGHILELDLQPHSVRAAGFEVRAQVDDGSYTSFEPAPARTLRGTLTGAPGSRVAASLLDDGLHARIRLADGEDYWLQPLQGVVGGAGAQDYMLYPGSAVLDVNASCGSDLLPLVLAGAPAAGPILDGGSGLKIAEVGCDADFEYFTDWGSVAGVQARVEFVIDTVNLQYESEVGISHTISELIVRTSASQPYTSTSAGTLLDQFQAEWNNNQGSVQRDVAHLFTGKSIDGGTIGIAYVGVVCNLTFGYGLVESDFNNNDACATDLSAHELGHNWNAGHCSCTSNTMNPFITCTNTFHPTFTIPTITSFRDSRTCLTDGTVPPPDPEVHLATSDSSTAQGSIASGSFQSTHSSNDAYEQLREERTGGNPARRRSRLSHVWTIDVPASSNYSFFVEAHHTANSEGDDFRFAYSRDGSAYTPMLIVTKIADDDSQQEYVFTEDIAGTLFVRVEDLDRTQGNAVQDSVFVDYMYVLTDPGGDVTPPSPPTGLSAAPGNGSVSLNWNDNTEPDLEGYTVYRATAAVGPYSALNTALLGTSDYVDMAVTNGTTYYYFVTADDTSGNESANSNEVLATPNAGGGPTATHVASIVVDTLNIGQGNKRGRAVVVVVDDTGAAVAGAVVTGTFTGDYNETVAATTNASGTATLLTTATQKGGIDFTFCVDGIVHGSLAYDAGANVQTCASF